jgi:hypothetical protein
MKEETLREATRIKEMIERCERTKSEITFLLKEQRCVELATMSIDCTISKCMWEIAIKEYSKMIESLKIRLEAL